MSNGTRNTTQQSLGNIREVCHILYIMTLCSRRLGLPLGGALHVSAQSRTKGADALTHTFALICVFVKNCLCRYNFSIPERERERETKSYRSPMKTLKNTNEHGCTHNGAGINQGQSSELPFHNWMIAFHQFFSIPGECTSQNNHWVEPSEINLSGCHRWLRGDRL